MVEWWKWRVRDLSMEVGMVDGAVLGWEDGTWSVGSRLEISVALLRRSLVQFFFVRLDTVTASKGNRTG